MSGDIRQVATVKTCGVSVDNTMLTQEEIAMLYLTDIYDVDNPDDKTVLIYYYNNKIIGICFIDPMRYNIPRFIDCYQIINIAKSNTDRWTQSVANGDRESDGKDYQAQLSLFFPIMYSTYTIK